MALDQEALNALRTDRGPALPSGGPAPRRRWWLVMPVLVVAVLALGWWWHSRAPEVSTVTAVPLPASAPAAAVLDASGYVVARRQATVSAKVTGKVAAIHVEEGMPVKHGQVLGTLDDSQARLARVLAERQIEATAGGLNESGVRLAEARRTLARNERLYADRLVAESVLDAARADVAALVAQQAALQGQLDVARSTLRLREQDLEDLVIRAPFDGVVISKDAQPGEMVSPISAGGGYTRTGIATIVDMDSREIEVDVNEAFIHRVSSNQRTEAVLDAYPDWDIPSHVISVVPAADRQKATVRVRIAFEALDPRILPDMAVKVRFYGEANPAAIAAAATTVLVPAEAIVSVDGRDHVWTVSDGIARRIAVSVGNTRDGSVEILQGLAAGASVIAPPVAGLADGARVRARPAG
jgi:RND family efflux transporter MFP subunit